MIFFTKKPQSSYLNLLCLVLPFYLNCPVFTNASPQDISAINVTSDLLNRPWLSGWRRPTSSEQRLLEPGKRRSFMKPLNSSWEDHNHNQSKTQVMDGYDEQPSNHSTKLADKSWYREPSYPQITKIFSDLAFSCTIYIVGQYDNKEPPLFRHIYNLCSSLGGPNCIQLITTEELDKYSWAWTDFNFQHTFFLGLKRRNATFEEYLSSRYGGGSPASSHFPQTDESKYYDFDWAYYKLFGLQKFGENCLVMVRFVDTQSPRYWHNDIMDIPYSGRIRPHFIFVSTNKGCQEEQQLSSNGYSHLKQQNGPATHCHMYDMPYVTFETTGSSITLVTYEKAPSGSIETYMHAYKQRYINVTNVMNFSRGKVEELWRQHQWKMKVRLHVTNTTTNETVSITSRMCGGAPLAGYYINMRYSGGRLKPRVLDPQEECAFEAILSKHVDVYKNESDTEVLEEGFIYQWPILVDFEDVHGSSLFEGIGKKGKVYIPGSGRFQGFKFAIYLDRKLIKSEFDLLALLKPFQAYVWICCVISTLALYLTMKMVSQESFSLFWILSVLVEQGKLKKSFLSSIGVIILTLVWLLGTILLRQLYTGNIFAAITAERVPPTPRNFSELLSHPHVDEFTIFVPATDVNELLSQSQGAPKNLNSKLLQSIRPLDNVTLMEMIRLRDDPSANPKEAHPRVALITYSHPTKLVFADFSNGAFDGSGETKWTPPHSYDTMLLTIGERRLIKTYDGIGKRLWIYQGKRNFFTELFTRDMDALIESGIYARWARETCRIVETRVLRDAVQLESNKSSWNYHAAACTAHFGTGRSTMTFDNVTFKALGVVWVVFLVGILISICGYLKEVVRFDIPGRVCQCLSCNVDKYKRD